jgi:hypothetical protein
MDELTAEENAAGNDFEEAAKCIPGAQRHRNGGQRLLHQQLQGPAMQRGPGAHPGADVTHNFDGHVQRVDGRTFHLMNRISFMNLIFYNPKIPGSIWRVATRPAHSNTDLLEEGQPAEFVLRF